MEPVRVPLNALDNRFDAAPRSRGSVDGLLQVTGGRGQAGLAARPLVVTSWTTTLTPLHGIEDAVLQVATRPLPSGVGTPKKSMSH